MKSSFETIINKRKYHIEVEPYNHNIEMVRVYEYGESGKLIYLDYRLSNDTEKAFREIIHNKKNAIQSITLI